MFQRLKQLKHSKDIALANKETLVTAGHIIMKLAKDNNVNIYPVDSEHSAIFQSLNGDILRRLKEYFLQHQVVHSEERKELTL